jgi:hypothetical protein
LLWHPFKLTKSFCLLPHCRGFPSWQLLAAKLGGLTSVALKRNDWQVSKRLGENDPIRRRSQFTSYNFTLYKRCVLDDFLKLGNFSRR